MPVTVTCNCLPLGPMIFHHYHGGLFVFTIFPALLFPSVTIYCHLLVPFMLSVCSFCFVYTLSYLHCLLFPAFFSGPFSDWIFSKENCELAKWSAKFKRKLKRQWQSRLELSLFLLGSAYFYTIFYLGPGLWALSEQPGPGLWGTCCLQLHI